VTETAKFVFIKENGGILRIKQHTGALFDAAKISNLRRFISCVLRSQGEVAARRNLVLVGLDSQVTYFSFIAIIIIILVGLRGILVTPFIGKRYESRHLLENATN